MKPKILIVDDEPSIRRMYTMVFQLNGFAVTTANDGVDVLDTVLKHPPDIVLMDVMMPNRNGIDALKDLKGVKQTQDIPVVMLSAYEDDDLLLGALDLGAKRYLVKSMLEPSEVVKIVKEVLAEDQASKK